MSDGREWHQFDAMLERPDSGLRFLIALSETLPAALARGDVAAAFFMQKPPGFRLRLAGSRDAVTPLVEAIGLPGIALSPGIYEPETYLFDGAAGLRCAHDAFTADSLAVCAYAAAVHRGTAIAAPGAFSLALCEQLLRRIGLDAWEAWDVWMRVLTLRGGDWQAVEPLSADLAPASGCAAILADHARRIDRLTSGLAGGARARVFPNGIRCILPFWIVFHWNRMGFDAEAQRSLAASAASRRHPRAACERAAAAWTT